MNNIHKDFAGVSFASLALENPADLPVGRAACTKAPIEEWKDLINSCAGFDMNDRLLRIYENNLPKHGEIIFTNACKFTCKHCIYSPKFNKPKTALTTNEWLRIIGDIHEQLNIRQFVHCGRSLNSAGIDALREIRNIHPDIKLGLIDNGISMIPYLDELSDLKLDWIDISIDGMEEEHDCQRGRRGAFKETIGTLSTLLDNEVAPMVNALICLTEINKESVIELIAFLNEMGIKNFFIAPVTTFADYGPPDNLRVSGRHFADFLNELSGSLGRLEDALVEVNMLDVEYIRDIKEHCPEIWHSFRPEEDHLECRTTQGDNDLYINYNPLSLNGIREFIVNSDGNVLLPLVMRGNRISEEDILGNLLFDSPNEVVSELRYRKLTFYRQALLNEKTVIGGL